MNQIGPDHSGNTHGANKVIVPVVLSGGMGTRLWPMSRELHPKQLMDLTGKLSLLQETVRRLDGLTDVGPLQILCNEQHRFIVAEQMRTMGIEELELVSKNNMF